MTREAPVVSVMDDIRMTELYKKNGWKMASLKRMWRYFVQRGATTLGEVPDFPKAVHKELSQAKYGLMTTSVVSVSDCADRSTTKLLIQLQDGQLVEVCVVQWAGSVRVVWSPACFAVVCSPSSCVTTSVPPFVFLHKSVAVWLAVSVPRAPWACVGT
jgi:adenine C2-methylase RlmN of 23S rRNA A2503 and tRNA A37